MMSGRKIVKGLKEAVSHAQQVKSTRSELGLDAAERGDLRALYNFLSWTRGELVILSGPPPLTKLPEVIREQLTTLSKEVQRTNDFIAGFAAASKRRRRW